MKFLINLGFIGLFLLTSTEPSLAKNPPRVVKIAMSSPIDETNNGVYIWLDAFAKHLQKNGLAARFYANASLGGDQERMDQLALDLLEINVTNPDEISRHSPTHYGLAAPFRFDSYQHMDRFLDQTEFIQRVNIEVQPRGFQLIDLAYTGAMVGLLTRKVPVYSLSDLQKIRLRFLSAPDLKLFSAWGVRGVQVAWSEVAQALQTGMVDGYLNPPSVATLYGHGNVLDYFTDLRMGPSARLIVVANSWLRSLNQQQLKVFHQAVTLGHQANRQWNLNYIAQEQAALARVGIQWLSPSQAQRQHWADNTVNFLSEKWHDPIKTQQVSNWIEQTRRASHE